MVAGMAKKFVGWSSNLPDFNLVESDEEHTELGKNILNNGAEKLLAR